ncbi:MAG: cell division protein FtsA [Asticcacaulis sp.]
MGFEAAQTFVQTCFSPRTPEGLRRRQARLWGELRAQFSRAPALKAFVGAELGDIPVIDTACFRARFADYNTLGLSLEAAVEAAQRAEAGEADDLGNGVSAGFSTGTGGGLRGLFVTTRDERQAYGAMLAGRLFGPADWLHLGRIAVCLRAGNRLYNRRGVRFFGLAQADRDPAIAAFDPKVLIAPPQVLLELAQSGHNLPSLRRLFYGAETLNETERAFVTKALGGRPDPIYQATEGFVGAPCRFGTLHLNDDQMIIEREDIGGGRFRPVITDLMRRSQLVVRLRLEDILRPTVCACGSPRQAVMPVEGRTSDVWRWGDKVVWPAEVEALVAPLLPAAHRWVATGSAQGIEFACAHENDAEVMKQALRRLGQPVRRVAYDPASDFPKRRHVRWRS